MGTIHIWEKFCPRKNTGCITNFLRHKKRYDSLHFIHYTKKSYKKDFLYEKKYNIL